jgi:hypothetical protein
MIMETATYTVHRTVPVCQSWDHPARRAEESQVRSLTARVMTNDVEVYGDGIQGGQCGRGA